MLASVAALNTAWATWLEDRLLPGLVAHRETEDPAQWWEFVVTTLAKIGRLVIGGGIPQARDIRTRLASALPGEAGLKTASLGVTFLSASDDIETLVERAEAALCAAKQHGRNRTETPPAPSTAA